MIKIENLNFHYKRNKPIFESLFLNMRTGIYGLLGENGVGKTTLLHIMAGLAFPKSGTCKVLGYTSATRNTDMLKQIFFLPEDVSAPSMHIKDFVRFHSVFYPNFSQENMSSYLDTFQLSDDLKLSELSFGQKKKAMMAFAMAVNTKITLLDEPTNGLDIPSKAQFRKIIASNFDEEKCIIISTHQVRDLGSLIDPIIILDNNRVLLNNTVEEITNKLSFSLNDAKPKDCLFCEQTIEGYKTVALNHDAKDTTLDLESLFNATINNKEQIKNLFNL